MIIDPYKFGLPRAEYGYLYNWWAATDALFAPTDWKLPTKAEFDTMFVAIGATPIAGGYSDGGGLFKQTGLTHWQTPNTSADNSTGFTALGGGYAGTGPETSQNRLQLCELRTATIFDATTSYRVSLGFNTDTISTPSTTTKNSGLSIRLLYTGGGSPSTMTDEDGNIYDVILIGSQYWTVQNWKCTKLNDSTPLTKITTDIAWAALTTEGYCAYNNDESLV